MPEIKPDIQISLPTDVLVPVAPANRNDPFSAASKWILISILIVTGLIYSRALSGDFLSMDDDTFILNNPLIRTHGPDGILSLFTTINNGKYQPLIPLTYLIEYRLFGFNAFVFHLINVTLHLLNTWLAFIFAKRLSGKTITASVVAALFALHPMHVEEVAWVSELKDTLPAFFYLLALICYLKYTDSGFQAKYYFGLVLFFVAALLSKSAFVTLPLILILIDIYKGRPLDKRAWLEKIPIIAGALFFLYLGMLSKSVEAASVDSLPVTFSFINRVFFFTYVPSFYVVSVVAPVKLAAMHYYPQVENGLLPWIYYASVPFFLLLIWLVARPSVFRRQLVFGVLFFAITISVMEQIVSIGPSLTPERYTYIPYIGFFYIIGQWLSKLSEGRWRNAAISLFMMTMILLCVVTWARIAVWKNDDTIFGDTIDKNAGSRDSYYSYFVLGNVKRAAGNIKEALLDYDESITLNPLYAGAYNNRGGLFFEINDMQSALIDFNHSIALDPRKANVYKNRGTVKTSLGDFEGAVEDYNHCLTMEPSDSRAYAGRGLARLKLGDAKSACRDFTTSLQYGNKEAAELLKQYCR
jgi:protein O-mannosyl-transferase